LASVDPSSGDFIKLTEGPDFQPDWQPITGPNRSDYKSAAKFCDADQAFLGEAAFATKYGTNANASNAYGKCVSQSNRASSF
jgi:hypothetical protein